MRPALRSSPPDEYSKRKLRSNPSRPSAPRGRRTPVACTVWSSSCTLAARQALRPNTSARSAAARAELHRAAAMAPTIIRITRVGMATWWRRRAGFVIGRGEGGAAGLVQPWLKDPALLLLAGEGARRARSEEHTSELQSLMR